MTSGTPFSMPSACGCSGPDGAGGSGPAAATSPCGNVAYSPINCEGCCGDPLDVLPPYVPSPADFAILPICNAIAP